MKMQRPVGDGDRSRSHCSIESTDAVRLVLADSQPIALAGMVHLFSTQRGFVIVSACNDGDQALRAVRRHRPDVLVLELKMAKKSGFSVLRELKSEAIATRPVLVTESLSEDEVLEAMRLGVKGVVLKDLPTDVIVQCVRKVHSGDIWLEPTAASRAVDRMVQRETGVREISRVLTPRELETVRSVASGFSNGEIAQQFVVSEGTVKTHLHNVFKKLQLRSRFELIIYAREHGLV